MPLFNPSISRAAPIKVGGNANAGLSFLASAFDHVHPLIESAGPTNLNMGSWLDGEILRRVGANMVGRVLRANSTQGSNSTSLATATDASPSLTFSLEGSRAYLALFIIGYTTASAATGLMLSANFTGTSSGNQRVAVLIATGATTMFSQTSASYDVLMGNPTVGPSGTSRLALVFVRCGTSGPGDLALRYASGVAGNSVAIAGESGGIVLQQ
jgi:hypothetical protein